MFDRQQCLFVAPEAAVSVDPGTLQRIFTLP